MTLIKVNISVLSEYTHRALTLSLLFPLPHPPPHPLPHPPPHPLPCPLTQHPPHPPHPLPCPLAQPPSHPLPCPLAPPPPHPLLHLFTHLLPHSFTHHIYILLSIYFQRFLSFRVHIYFFLHIHFLFLLLLLLFLLHNCNVSSPDEQKHKDNAHTKINIIGDLSNRLFTEQDHVIVEMRSEFFLTFKSRFNLILYSLHRNILSILYKYLLTSSLVSPLQGTKLTNHLTSLV